MADRHSNALSLLSLTRDQLLLLGMLPCECKFRLNGNQILKNLMHTTDRQRIMTFVLNEARFAIWQTACDFFRKANRESAIFLSVPESHRHAHIFDREPPRLRVNLRIWHYAFGRGARGAPLTFCARVNRC